MGMTKPTIQYICARCNQPCASGERTCASPECNAGPRALDAMEIDPARARAVAEILDRMERRRQWGAQMTPRERAIKCAANYEERQAANNEGPYDALIEDITTEIQAASNAVEMKYRAKYGPPTLRVQKKHPDAKMPTRAYGQAAAFDLYALETFIVGNDEPVKARTGIAIEIPPGYFAKIESRSSIALSGVFATGGVIDADYRGEIHVILNNFHDEPALFGPGDRIAQMLVLPVFQGGIEEVAELTPTERGDKGFGSTGR